MATIQELVERRAELVALLAEVDGELRSRHGQVDEPKTADRKTAVKTATKK